MISCISHIAFGLRSIGNSSRFGFVGKQSGAGENPSGRKGGGKCVMVLQTSSKVLTLPNCSGHNRLICIHSSNNVWLTSVTIPCVVNLDGRVEF